MKRQWLGFLLSIACSQLAYAEDVETSAKLNELESGISTVKEDLQRLAQQKEDQEVLLAEIEQHYGVTASALRDLQQEIDLKNKSLANIHREMQVYQAEIAQLSVELAAQIRAAYAMGQQETLKLLLSQKDPALSSRMMAYFNYINEERLKNLKAKGIAVAHLQQLDKQKQLETQRLEDDIAQKKLEQAKLDADRKQRNELLIKIGNDFSSSEQQLSQLQISENRLKSLMATLPITAEELAIDGEPVSDQSANTTATVSNVDFTALKGQLPWPIQGNLANAFGSPRADTVWDGVLISAEEGTEIKAVSRGKVAFAGELRGYGLLTIVDHGQGYLTLYAFNQSQYKHQGDTVEAGDIIASVGLSGGRSQAGLYFGIRKGLTPLDPAEWCQ